ncbi:hydrolase [Clostridium sp. P21]|uniref:Hydrolase n=1 Tax=Clostridium muellerianum TaxID=2716538 RepID=A0A7Y0HLX2_9CLOT|nr:glucosaminidase domain-containing protein [Clostridium muellerianum]NMM61620.1 hydrolase [Clostridium muellerianum]
MNKNIKMFILTMVCSLAIVTTKVSAEDLSIGSPKVNIVTSKEWTVKFNAPLKADTVNNKNITVKDENNKVIPVSISLGKNSDTVIISPQASGYDPNKKYSLTVGSDVQSESGKKLKNSFQMQFSIDNKYEDGSNYESLPQITSCKFQYSPLLPTQNQGFILNTKNGQDVEYRIFVHSYSTDKDSYTEITNGYTKSSDGKITAVKTLDAGSSGQKYKVLIYVKRSGNLGAHKDINTDYDNYYVDYFRCVNAVDTNNNEDESYNVSLDQMVDTQTKLNDKSVFVETNDFNNEASKNQIKYYLDPNNFMDSYGKYQFLKLSYTDGMSVDDVNNILKGKGILEGKGQAFLDAAKNNNISIVYLISHSLLETGNGTSLLANGGQKDSSGKYIFGQPVYNFFGIGAYDKDPNYYGTKTAYDNKWLTPEDAISGGTQWIASKYINNPSGKQDTLYKMRWNPSKPGEHQYATDVAWAYKQIPNMINGIKDIINNVKNIKLNFEIPKFK